VNYLRELQLLANDDNDYILNTRRELVGFIDFFKNQTYQDEAIECFAIERQLKPETLKKLDGFFIDPDFPSSSIPKKFHQERFGIFYGYINKYAGRFIFPVYQPGAEKLPMGLVGYDKFERPKYLDSTTVGYKAKKTTFFGMEELHECYSYNGPVFFTEGPICMAFLRENNYKAFSLLGSNMTEYVKTIIRRFKYPIIVPDADDAGSKLYRKLNSEFRVCQPPLALGKDIDDARKNDLEATLLFLNKLYFKKGD